MALISGRTIITSLSLFHITLGFFFLTNPISVADQALVYVLGEAMGMPYSRAFDVPSPALAFLAVIIAGWGFSDLITLSLPEEVCLVHYWGTQAPLRVLISMVTLFYSFFFSASSPFYGGSGGGSTRISKARLYEYEATSIGDHLKNRVLFSFMFIETVSWFWLWVTLREERVELLARKASRRRSHSYN